MAAGLERDDEALIDVRQAAHLIRRSPETVRRWVWAGRLVASRQGHRLLVSPGEVLALGARGSGTRPKSLGDWAQETQRARTGVEPGEGSSAADLVLSDRARRARQARQR